MKGKKKLCRSQKIQWRFFCSVDTVSREGTLSLEALNCYRNAAYHPPGKSKEAPASRIDMKYTKDTGNLPQQLASLQQVEGGTEQAEKPLTDEHSQESAEGLIPAAR